VFDKLALFSVHQWVLENADYMHLIPIKEKCKKARELAEEAEE
jgi:hypothetical protein